MDNEHPPPILLYSQNWSARNLCKTLTIPSSPLSLTCYRYFTTTHFVCTVDTKVDICHKSTNVDPSLSNTCRSP